MEPVVAALAPDLTPKPVAEVDDDAAHVFSPFTALVFLMVLQSLHLLLQQNILGEYLIKNE